MEEHEMALAEEQLAEKATNSVQSFRPTTVNFGALAVNALPVESGSQIVSFLGLS